MSESFHFLWRKLRGGGYELTAYCRIFDDAAYFSQLKQVGGYIIPSNWMLLPCGVAQS